MGLLGGSPRNSIVAVRDDLRLDDLDRVFTILHDHSTVRRLDAIHPLTICVALVDGGYTST